MSSRIDLHVHTTYSDGSETPEEILRKAEEVGLAAVAFTDHDTVEGIRSLPEGSGPVEVIPGVELSVMEAEQTEIHILGYFVDTQQDEFLGALRRMADHRIQRGAGIVDKINGMLSRDGLQTLDFSVIRQEIPDVVGRPHIARHLVTRGYVPSLEEAFSRYLVPCNLPKSPLTPEDGIKLIHRAGGMAVLAHPAKLQLPGGEPFDAFVGRLAESGLDGMEVYYARYSREETENLRRIAERWGLALTGGSDYHGANKAVELGTPPLALALLEKLRERWARSRWAAASRV